MARKIGRYEIVKELGEGQYGAVYQAVGQVPGRGRQPGRRRVVAIKALKNQADPESAAALVQEFALLDQVKHRGIVRVFEYLEHEHAVVMEYVHGATLRTVLDTLAKNRDQVFTEAAVEIGCEIADALFQAYTTPGDNGEPLQLVHRDLKPVNVMLTPTGEVKVLDWGLAKVDNTEFRADNSDQIKGSLLYMSPEQARGDAVDHRSDLFSLGSILFETLMNEPLYTVDERAADPLAKVMADIERGDTAGRCALLDSNLPKVGPTISRTLRTRPGDRYENGQELLVDLRRTLNRPRGVDLKEFAEYFFGQYLDIGEAPDPDKLGTKENQTGRMSIEERLRRSMARQNKASADVGALPEDRPVRGGGGRASRPPRSSSPPRAPRSRASSPPRARSAPPRPPSAPSSPPSAPPAPPQAPTQGDDMAGSSRGGGGRKPPRPPVGGGASRASPFAPPQAPPRKKRRQIGERAPDETGMLSMVPLSQDDDEDEVAHDPSATAFFALPPPKAARNAAPPAPPAAPRMGGAPPPPAPMMGGGMGAPPPPPMAGGMPPASPRPGFAAHQPPPVAAPMGGGGPPPPAIRGPVAGGGGGQASPFQVQQQAPPPPAADSGRVTNYTAYVAVLGLMMLVCTAVLLAVFFAPDDKEEVAAKQPSSDGVANLGNAPPKKSKPARAADTGDPPEEKPKKKKRTTTKKSTGGSSAPARPAAPKKPTGGTLTVKLTDPSVSQWIYVTCPSGFSGRGSFSGGTARVSGVPPESCTISFKGGSPAKHVGVSGGQTVTCSPQGNIGNCR